MAASPKPEPLKIFISHSTADLEAAREVYRALREAGFRAWMREDLRDEDVELGSTWHEMLDLKLRTSDVVLALVSGATPADLYQSQDLQSARHDRQRIVPAYLEPDAKRFGMDLLGERRGELIDSAEGLQRLIRGLQRLSRGEPGMPLREPVPTNEPVRGRLRIRRLVLENVRCFENLDLPVADGTGWITVLGDNAAGKSTLLRSLALGLCQESDAAALMRELPGSMIREGAGSGAIRIELHDAEEDRDLLIVTLLRRDESTGEEILRKETSLNPFPWNKLFVCGYGTNRGRQAHAGFESYTVRDAVRTLFDDDASLQNPELVLLRQNPDLRQEIEHKVLQILMLDAPGYEVTYPKTGPVIEGPWGRQALRVLSDGYRSTMQWVLDFIGWGIYAGRFNGGRELGGILLIDELEQHLHPVWQRHIWLAYEWTNLLPACVRCNQDDVRQGRRIGKHCRFPVEGRHAQRPEEVAQEKPLLINPLSDHEADDPSHHLVVDTKTGVLGHRTARGQACIEIFGLNERDQLVADRRKACREAEFLWARLFSARHDPADKAEILKEIEAIHRGEKAFTAAQGAVLRELAELAGLAEGPDT